jgi:hypothetical protein
MDAEGRPIQWLHEQHLLSEPIENLLFRQPVLLQEVNRLPPASREGELQEGAKHETMSRNAPDRTIGIDG